MCASKQKPAAPSLNSGFVRGLSGRGDSENGELGMGNWELGKGNEKRNSGFVSQSGNGVYIFIQFQTKSFFLYLLF